MRAEGLSYAAAAHKLAWLIAQALQLGQSGIALKDESEGVPPIAPPAGAAARI